MEPFIVLVICAALAFIPAGMAKKKGYSYGGFWVFGLFLWLPAIIVTACMSDKTVRQNVYYPPQPYSPPYAAPAPPLPVYRPVAAPQAAQAASKPAPRTCAYCGTQTLGDSEICNSCGAKL